RFARLASLSWLREPHALQRPRSPSPPRRCRPSVASSVGNTRGHQPHPVDDPSPSTLVAPARIPVSPAAPARRRAPCHAGRAGAGQQPGGAGREGVGSAVVSLRRSSIVLALFVGLLVPAATSPQARIAVPAGFHVDVFAPTLAGARFMTLDPAGTILLSL